VLHQRRPGQPWSYTSDEWNSAAGSGSRPGHVAGPGRNRSTTGPRTRAPKARLPAAGFTPDRHSEFVWSAIPPLDRRSPTPGPARVAARLGMGFAAVMRTSRGLRRVHTPMPLAWARPPPTGGGAAPPGAGGSAPDQDCPASAELDGPLPPGCLVRERPPSPAVGVGRPGPTRSRGIARCFWGPSVPRRWGTPVRIDGTPPRFGA